MQIAPEQLAGLLEELVANQLLLTEDELGFITAMHYSLAGGMPYTQEQAQQVQTIYHAMVARQFAG